MTGWNLPPGCNVSDIPGNRPEDEAEERWIDSVYAKAQELGVELTDDTDAPIWMLLLHVHHEGMNEGFQDGRAEGQMDVYAKWEAADEARESHRDAPGGRGV